MITTLVLLAALFSCSIPLQSLPQDAADPTKPAGITADQIGAAAAKLKSIDPADEDFADLAALKAAIGDSRVVVLGEQSHGDGAVFLAKARIIKFLHQECGFDVLVWESGIYDCSRVHEALKAGGGMEAFDLGVFPIWTRSAQVRPTLDYVIESYKTDRPLEIAGYDCQITSRLTDIDKAIIEFLAPLGQEHKAVKLAAEVAPKAVAARAEPEKFSDELAELARNAGLLVEAATAEQSRLIEAHGEARAMLMLQSIRSLAPFLEMTSAMFGPKPDQWAGGNARDTQMGTNLAFLAQRIYPDRKLIVWCATFHAMHDANTVSPVGNAKMYERAVTAGEVARAALGERMYTIGFEAHTGQAGAVLRPQPTTLPTSPTGSIGAALAERDGRFLFVDFRGLAENHPLRKPQVTRQLGYMPATAVWPRQVDGIVFTREMFPSTAEGLKPEGYELADAP